MWRFQFGQNSDANLLAWSKSLMLCSLLTPYELEALIKNIRTIYDCICIQDRGVALGQCSSSKLHDFWREITLFLNIEIFIVHCLCIVAQSLYSQP